ncbi:MAG: type II toxin-antitoxin system RelE/ParE family toxin [Myxococcota bacterium]
MRAVREFQLEDGTAPFADWFESLPAAAANRVMVVLRRMRQGNLGDWKSVGEGVAECRIHFDKGYRVYFGRDGDSVIILLGGGTKKRQGSDIKAAQRLWKKYKETKRSTPGWH